MPKAYSLDFREKIFEAYSNKEGTIEALAKRFKISISTVKRIGQRYRETGKIELYLENCGRRPKLDDKQYQILKAIIKKTPDLTLKEIKTSLYKATGIEMGISSLHYIIEAFNLNYKKKSLYAAQRDTEEIKKKE